jgi:hypothetical protein
MMRWTATIIIGWGALLGWSTIHSNLPASWWFVAGEVRVYDARSDECPAMDFHRDFRRDFHADWVVTVMRQRSDGRFATFRTFPGENDYRPGNELPEVLDLCWWTDVADLRLPDGIYRVYTLWRLHVDGGVREIRRTSRPFQITG